MNYDSYPDLWILHYSVPSAGPGWVVVWVWEEGALEIQTAMREGRSFRVPVEGVSRLPTTVSNDSPDQPLVLEPPLGSPHTHWVHGNVKGVELLRLGEVCDDAKFLGL